MNTCNYIENIPFFFLHIPRTGGTTLDSIIFRNIKDENILKVYTKKEYEQNLSKTPSEMESIKFIAGHLLLQNYDPPLICNKRVNVFTFLREPVQRLISEYIFYKTWKNQHMYKIINDAKMTFRDYLLSRDKLFIYRGKNFMTRVISGKSIKRDEYPLSALALAKRRLEKDFFFFGIMEYFDESLIMLNNFLNLSDIFYEKRNKLKKVLKDEISDDDKELASELNKADVNLYKFAKNLFEERVSLLGDSFREKVVKFKKINETYENISNIIYRENVKNSDDIILSKDELW